MVSCGRRRAMLDTDLEGLGPKEAQEYVLAFVTTLKQTEKDLARAEEEVATWTKRVALAESRGESSLAAQAKVRLAEEQGRKALREAELAELGMKVSILKEKLARLRMMPIRSIDPDLLLAQLEMVTGKKDELSLSLKEEEAKARLEELKKRMS
jgi:phage shock protein A